MSIYKKHVDRRVKEPLAIERAVERANAFVIFMHMRNNTKGLFVAGRRVL